VHILLAEDDPLLGRAVEMELAHEGMAVHWARDGVDAYAAIQMQEYAALLLDLGLPGLNGLDLLHRVRQTNWDLPVLVITARASVDDRVKGLDFGADDYMSKPFDLDELMARLRAVTRRVGSSTGKLLTAGPIEVDLRNHRVTVDGNPVWLTGREYSVLLLLMTSLGQAVSKHRIESQLFQWGNESIGNVVEVHVHNLRKKLGRDLIQTYRGTGYMITHFH